MVIQGCCVGYTSAVNEGKNNGGKVVTRSEVVSTAIPVLLAIGAVLACFLVPQIGAHIGQFGTGIIIGALAMFALYALATFAARLCAHAKAKGEEEGAGQGGQQGQAPVNRTATPVAPPASTAKGAAPAAPPAAKGAAPAAPPAAKGAAPAAPPAAKGAAPAAPPASTAKAAPRPEDAPEVK